LAFGEGEDHSSLPSSDNRRKKRAWLMTPPTFNRFELNSTAGLPWKIKLLETPFVQIQMEEGRGEDCLRMKKARKIGGSTPSIREYRGNPSR